MSPQGYPPGSFTKSCLCKLILYPCYMCPTCCLQKRQICDKKMILYDHLINILCSSKIQLSLIFIILHLLLSFQRNCPPQNHIKFLVAKYLSNGFGLILGCLEGSHLISHFSLKLFSKVGWKHTPLCFPLIEFDYQLSLWEVVLLP